MLLVLGKQTQHSKDKPVRRFSFCCLQAQRDSQAAKPTRILTSKHQQEALSGKQVRARFTESQSSFPSSSHGSSSTGSRPAQHSARQQHQQDDQPQQSTRRHAAFSDFAVVQPYSIFMFAWSVCLVCTGVSLPQNNSISFIQGHVSWPCQKALNLPLPTNIYAGSFPPLKVL